MHTSSLSSKEMGTLKFLLHFFTFYPVSFWGEKIGWCGQPCLPCTPCQVRGARRWAAVRGHPPPTGPPHPRAQLSPARCGPTCSPVSEGAAEATRGLLLCCCWTWNSSHHTAGNQYSAGAWLGFCFSAGVQVPAGVQKKPKVRHKEQHWALKPSRLCLVGVWESCRQRPRSQEKQKPANDRALFSCP